VSGDQNSLLRTEAELRRKLDAHPADAALLADLGRVLRKLGRSADALPILEKAAALSPADPGLLCDLADLRQTLRDFDAALAEYRAALDLNPKLARAWYAAGCAEGARKEFAAAIPCFRQALEISPDWREAKHNLGQVLFKLGQVEEALDLFRQAAATGDAALPLSAIAVMIPGSPASGNQAILEARRCFAERYLPAPRAIPPGPRRQGRLRIGYVSAFFEDRNWMKPVWCLINHHYRQDFEIHLFSDGPASAIQHGYEADRRDRFHDSSRLSNEALCQEIRQAEIDVLVDLNGYSTLRRLPLFPLRPAPVIVGWFNMYATMGISSYDYLIGDAVVIPPEEERFYCEKILRVEGSYLTFEVTYPVPPVADEPPSRASGAITFGCLASQYKITADVIASWSRILQRAPGSSLLLKNGTLGSPANRRFVHDRFSQLGIGPERVRLDGPAEHYQFLEAYGQIDIALDAFPYNGGTTTMESIWQGVPLITFRGDRWVARTSASILETGGLGELIGQNLDDYENLAVALANAPDRLLDLRRNMRARLTQSAVCDGVKFARNMEALYRQIS
jgi:tetratricopeptide (TPR) repeat protein